MKIDEAINILRGEGFDVVVTLEEYFVITNGNMVMVSEKYLIDRAKKITKERV